MSKIMLKVNGVSYQDIERAQQVLVDNGIDENEADCVLQALGYVLLDTELYPNDEEDDEEEQPLQQLLTIGIQQLHPDIPDLLDVLTQENEGIYGYTINFTAYRETDKWNNVMSYYLYPQNSDRFEPNDNLFPGLDFIFAEAAARHADVIRIVLCPSAIIDGCPIYE